MRILHVTHNAELRSTSCMLDAVLHRLRPCGLEPVMLFRTGGPWQSSLGAEGIRCCYHPLRPLDKWRPFTSFRDLASLVRIIRRERIDIIHVNEHDHYPLLKW